MCIVLSFKYKSIIAFGRWGSFLPSCKMPPCVLVHYYYFAMVKTSVHDLVMKALHIEHYFLVGKAFTILQSIGNQGLVEAQKKKKKS